jgi:hypothetical protein
LFTSEEGSAQKMGQRVMSREELGWQEEFFRPEAKSGQQKI